MGRCGNVMLFVEMLGDMVGRRDIEVGGSGCVGRPAWATDDTPVGCCTEDVLRLVCVDVINTVVIPFYDNCIRMYGSLFVFS